MGGGAARSLIPFAVIALITIINSRILGYGIGYRPAGFLPPAVRRAGPSGCRARLPAPRQSSQVQSHAGLRGPACARRHAPGDAYMPQARDSLEGYILN